MHFFLPKFAKCHYLIQIKIVLLGRLVPNQLEQPLAERLSEIQHAKLSQDYFPNIHNVLGLCDYDPPCPVIEVVVGSVADLEPLELGRHPVVLAEPQGVKGREACLNNMREILGCF